MSSRLEAAPNPPKLTMASKTSSWRIVIESMAYPLWMALSAYAGNI